MAAQYMLAVVIAALSLFNTISAQFVQPPTDLKTTKGYLDIPVRYKQVPTGTCETNPNVKSFTGYVDVQEDEHIFFWFFEARNEKPENAPLTVWINGGPGSSSMIGLFQELGPCSVDSNGTVVNNPYAWNNASNMIFIDQPATTGFSYTKLVPGYVDPSTESLVALPSNECPEYAQAYGTCGTYSAANVTLTANTTGSAAENFYRTLQGFMGAFPQYSREDFHFATESYGGHYGPIFNKYIEEQNAHRSSKAHKIKLKSVMIGNGWYSPEVQYAAYYNFTVSPGNTYDYRPFNSSVEHMMYNNLFGPGNCLDQIRDCYSTGTNQACSTADTFCADNVESILDLYANRDEYDIRELSPDPFPYSFYIDYLNTPAFQKAIGAFQNFSESSSTVSNAFSNTGDDGREEGTIEDVRALLDQGVQVVMYAGDADYNCNWLGGEVIAEQVQHKGFDQAGYQDLETSDGVTHGQVKQSGQFSFVRIYESGHEVPFYQPLASLELFQRVLKGTDLATGKDKISRDSTYKTIGPAKSTYREGNGTVQFEVLPPDATYNTTLNAPNKSNQAPRDATVQEAYRFQRVGEMLRSRYSFQRTFML
ncbi:putative carboxypeptidase 2 [Mycosarcoma maydis]|uniref:Carboxypeptidase 2 n=1 Tax=Mycosarcoma maydis TaxID=5270 RepID=A0A0D1CME9_MYCMD|nr:putative carboxypeptidase 2 [Ustilago maydis 521]KIS67893.1 putative carboxypeptidase 2 [Ustilago maydis 521]|eukprot:XP_011390416.1 putative carboxypeptidase 2 [Ustilago maydis 521]